MILPLDIQVSRAESTSEVHYTVVLHNILFMYVFFVQNGIFFSFFYPSSSRQLLNPEPFVKCLFQLCVDRCWNQKQPNRLIWACWDLALTVCLSPVPHHAPLHRPS